jgi:hypothetical protein
VRNPFEPGEDDGEEVDESSVPDVPEPGPPVPEAPDPESSIPDVTPDTDPEDVDTGLRIMFWRLVFLYKFAIIGTTLGVLLLVFERGPDVGLPLLVGGLVLFAYTLYQTKRGKERLDAGEFDTGDADETASSETAADGSGETERAEGAR